MIEMLPIKDDQKKDHELASGGVQVIQDKKYDFNKIKFTPNRDPEASIDIHLPAIWKSFPFSERFWYAFCCRSSCVNDYKNNVFYINEAIANPCFRDPKLELINKFISLKIIRSGTLEIEPMIVHPFVRVSIVNIKTGRYLQKSNFEVPVLSLLEKNLIVSHNRLQNIIEYRESPLDFIPPQATGPYDLREKGESFAEWNEELFINEDAGYILDSNNIIFFELIDFNLFAPTHSSEECMIPIAWGYLKPIGYSRTYLGKYKIQLYKHKLKRTAELEEFRKKNAAFLRTPDVVYELNWIRKEKYQTFLEIEITTELKPRYEDMSKLFFAKKFKNSVFAIEGEEEDKDIFKIKLEQEKKIKYEEMDQKANEKRKILLKRKKGSQEDCMIPDKLLFKFSTAKLGCLTHEFSNNGKYIAAACTEMSSITTIKIFNVEEGVLRYHFKGHHQIIHSFSWSFDDQILISASADNNVSLWSIPHEESNDIENIEFMDNEKQFNLTSLPHPSYVYSTAIYPEKSNELMILATACFDGIVRIFSLNFNYDPRNFTYTFVKSTQLYEVGINQELEKLDYRKSLTESFDKKEIQLKEYEKATLLEKTVLDHRHPNSIVFDEAGKLFIGDSLGFLHIWELRIYRGKPSFNKIKYFSHKELEGDNINKIVIEPSEKKRLIIHSRDNCIRLVDISRDKPRVIMRYFGLKCNKTNIKSTISPDGNYILSGSEEGRPYIWSLQSGIQLDTNPFECKFLDSVSDVSWNNEYNMLALSGFGQEYPLLVYVFEKTDVTIDVKDIKLKGEKNILMNHEKATDDERLFHSQGRFHLTPNQDHTSNFLKEYKSLIQPSFDANQINKIS